MARTLILGGGMTGLAAGFASGLPIYEAAQRPGGICSSYYMRPGAAEPLGEEPTDGEVYRFEIGGGHWIFGGDKAAVDFMQRHVTLAPYARRSSVFLTDEALYIPYPLQYHLRFLGPSRAARALAEMSAETVPPTTVREWLRHHFGDLLCDLFFDRFHALYTAGLYDRIAAEDAYKSPVDIAVARQGAFQEVAPAGYNARFVYPTEGLGVMARRMAASCDVRYGRRVIRIEPGTRRVVFADGGHVEYDKLISTLPLNRMIEYCGIDVGCLPDPYTSVLVLNVGARRGERCPNDHWVYFPVSRSGFHRVGFYSAVDDRFLPYSARGANDRVSIYVERAYAGGMRPSEAETRRYTAAVVQELRDLGYINIAEVSHPTWIDVAYTWSWPQSPWRECALRKLEELGIWQVGRYGRWIFQGIADSIRDGLDLGNRFKD